MLLLARSTRFADHEAGDLHPERPARLAAIDRALEGLDHVPCPLRPATETELARVHEGAYLRRLDRAAGTWTQLDPDTGASPESVEVARLAAGSTAELVRRVATGEAETGLALVRPPGHHALPETAMGFCLYGNISVAARALLDEGIVGRIAIYDWDVHHGNGTQDVFYRDPDVLFMSTHQAPFYPGSGAREERGAGPGEGTTLNFPLPAGAADEELFAVTDDFLAPAVRDFGPDIILVSAGYDAHADDPLGGMRVSTEGFRGLAEKWRALAQELCGGKIAGVLEGGYDLEALGASVRATAEAWS